MSRDREIAEIIADVKEHVLYLQELGVEDFRVAMPEDSAHKSEPPALAGGTAPRTGSTREGIRDTRRSVEKVNAGSRDGESLPPPNAGGSDLQKRSGTRLAALPSLSKRRPVESDEISGTVAAGGQQVQDAPALPEVKGPKESLFGEIGPALPDSGETVEDIWAEVGNCTRCPLFEGRTQVVHTTGNYNADLMFIGEAPGADEDAKGEPFVGRAGQLLNKIIEAIGMTRSEVAIGNINRCRPPGNRAPTLPEAHTCRPFLLREIAVIKPKVIVVLGNTALHNLLDTKVGITKVRGKFQDYFGVKVMPTFHPAYLLRDPHKKRETWEDMKMVRDYLNSLSS
jgi:uracil-DNA glycosylase